MANVNKIVLLAGSSVVTGVAVGALVPNRGIGVAATIGAMVAAPLAVSFLADKSNTHGNKNRDKSPFRRVTKEDINPEYR